MLYVYDRTVLWNKIFTCCFRLFFGRRVRRGWYVFAIILAITFTINYIHLFGWQKKKCRKGINGTTVNNYSIIHMYRVSSIHVLCIYMYLFLSRFIPFENRAELFDNARADISARQVRSDWSSPRIDLLNDRVVATTPRIASTPSPHKHTFYKHIY